MASNRLALESRELFTVLTNVRELSEALNVRLSVKCKFKLCCEVARSFILHFEFKTTSSHVCKL